MESFSMVAPTGSIQFRINHSKTKDMNIGKWITSPTFRVGPFDWAIVYYPQGNERGNNGKDVSFFLQLLQGSEDVAVKFGFVVLLDKHGYNSSNSLKELSYTYTPGGLAWGWPRFLQRTELEETYVKDGYFVLQVSIKLKDKSYNEAANTSSTDLLLKDVQIFRNENKYTDVIFDIAGTKFVAHRLILAAQSRVFEAEHFGSMAESKMECISIKEMGPLVFKAMLDFMYNGSLPVDEKLIESDEVMASVSFLANLLAAANRYAVEQLKTICEQKLQKIITMDTVLSLLELAERYDCSELKKDCFQFIVDKENSFSLMFSEGYINLMQNYPSLLVELKVMASK